MKALCEPVMEPRGQAQYIRYFAAIPRSPDDLSANEAKRLNLYKSVAAYVAAYANLANELEEAGYPAAEAAKIKGGGGSTSTRCARRSGWRAATMST